MADFKLTDQVAVVTGASRGIGRAMALELAKRGAHVVAIARTEGGLTELDDDIREATGTGATLVPLDLTDGEAVDRLGAALYERFGRIDILIANAGVLGPITPLSHTLPKDWEQVIGANLTSNWRLIRSFDALLRQSLGARVVFVTSGAARSLRPYWGPYAISKAGLEAMAITYARELDMTPHKVNLFNPGATRTKMRATAMPGEDPDTLPSPEEVAAGMMVLVDPELNRTGATYVYRDHAFAD